MSFPAPLARRALVVALAGLERHRDLIDRANVFPVPDGDTGTNMAATLRAAVEAPEGEEAEAALRGARGNSGVILAQMLNELLRSEVPAEGLARAAAAARGAVLEPREGTMLSVADAAARAAAGEKDRPFDVAATGALAALERTREILTELAAWGVVDAGGIGLCVVLEAFAATAGDREPRVLGIDVDGDPARRARESGPGEARYEVQFVVETTAGGAARLRRLLAAAGDSVGVAGRGGLWTVHVHAADANRALALGRDAGAVTSVSVTPITGGRAGGLEVASPGIRILVPLRDAGVAPLVRVLGGEPVLWSAEPADGEDVVALGEASDLEMIRSRGAAAVETRDLAATIAALLAGGASVQVLREAAERSRTAVVPLDGDVVVAARSLEPEDGLLAFTSDDAVDTVSRLLSAALPSLAIDVRPGGPSGAVALIAE